MEAKQGASRKKTFLKVFGLIVVADPGLGALRSLCAAHGPPPRI